MDKELTIKEHLSELKKRIIIVLIVFSIIFFLLFLFSEKIILFIINYFQLSLVTLKPMDYIMTQLNLSLFGSIALIIPIMLYQVYQFIRPMLIRATGIVKYYVWSMMLAITGMIMGFTIFTKALLRFLEAIPIQIQNQWSLLATMNMIIIMSVLMAIIFQIVIIIPLLVKWKILKVGFMSKSRKYILVLTLIISAIITPTIDPVNLILFSLPIYLCFEIGSIIARLQNNLNEHIKTLKDNFGADFYAVDFGFKKQKTWNLLIKDYGFKVCKNKRFLENELYYINNNMYLTYLTIIKK